MRAFIRYAGARPGRSRVEHIAPCPFPSPIAGSLRGALAVAHAAEPFRPDAPREAARRIVVLAERFGFAVATYRGGLDVGGAELDHVWAVVDGRVIDPAVPLYSEAFTSALRAYVAGDIDEAALERAAHPYSVAYRVIGSYPAEVRYVGAPVWSAAS